MKKYGGVNNQQSIDEMQEAEVYVKPPVHYSTLRILLSISLCAVSCALAIAGGVFLISAITVNMSRLFV